MNRLWRLVPRRGLRIWMSGPADQAAAVLSGLAALVAHHPDFGARPGGRRIRIDLDIREPHTPGEER